MSDDEGRRGSDEEDDSYSLRRRRRSDDSDEDEDVQEEESQPEPEVDEAAEAERRRQEAKEEKRRRAEEEEKKRREQKTEEERRKKEAQARMKAAQAKKKGGSKKKGLCLTPEKKKLLKQLIMEKAAEEMRAEAKKRAEEKERHINAHVPPLSLDGLDKSGLLRKIQEMYKLMKDKEEDKYDNEIKIRKQDLEINDLTSKVNDIKGKFVKPVLKKVTKTEKLSKVEKKAGMPDIRSSLKSTGQSKYQLDDQPSEPKTPDWRGNLAKAKDEGAAETEVNGDLGGDGEEIEA